MKCSCLITMALSLGVGALDAVLFKKMGLDLEKPTSQMLIVCMSLTGMSLILSVGIFFYCDENLHRVGKFRWLGFFMMAQFLSKAVLLVYYILKGELSVILKYGLLEGHRLEFSYFTVSAVLEVFVLWLALLFLFKLKNNPLLDKGRFKPKPATRRRVMHQAYTYTGPETRADFNMYMP